MLTNYPVDFSNEVNELAKELNIPFEQVYEIWESQFNFIKEKNKKINLKDISNEDFDNYKLNYNLKYIGILNVNKEFHNKIIKKYEKYLPI